MEVDEFNFSAQHFSTKSFWLITEPDLRELGFTMGPRKLLLTHICEREKGETIVEIQKNNISVIRILLFS